MMKHLAFHKSLQLERNFNDEFLRAVIRAKTSLNLAERVSVWFLLKKSVPITGPVVAQRVDRSIALRFHDRDIRKG